MTVFKNLILFSWSLFNLAIFCSLVFLFLRLIPRLTQRIRIILTCIITLVFVLSTGISFKKHRGIHKNNPYSPYKTFNENIEIGDLGMFTVVSFAEYQLPKKDKTLEPVFKNAECYLRGFYLGYRWSQPRAKVYIRRNHRKGIKELCIESHGEIELLLLGIKVYSRTYSLSGEIPLSEDQQDYN